MNIYDILYIMYITCIYHSYYISCRSSIKLFSTIGITENVCETKHKVYAKKTHYCGNIEDPRGY